MKLKTIWRKLLRFLGMRVLFFIVNLLCRSLKIKTKNRSAVKMLLKREEIFVAAFWHGTMLAPWYMFRNQKAAALVSQSEDGELLARILEKWKYRLIRGSSNAGGKAALADLVNAASEKRRILMTPDGPRGPLHKFKAGAVITAKRAGVPLILVGVHYKSNREFKSWDKFQMPKFFSRVNMVFSDPIYIDAGLSFEETSRIISECEGILNNLQIEASTL